MRFRIHTIEKTIFDGEVSGVTFPTEEGEITVLENHLPIITLVRPGAIKIFGKEGETEKLDFGSTGFLEVRPEQEGLVLLAE